jgi:hypothetical protein
MPKIAKDKNKSIFVKFKEYATDKEINKFLYSLGIHGVRVSTLVNRWVVEIPFWREGHFTEKMLDSSLVDIIHENFDRNKKFKSQERQEGEENE